MKIAIPSYKRYAELGQKTLTFLSGMKGFCQDDITIFVADEIEFNHYYERYAEFNIVIGEKGIVNIRNFINQYYDKDEYIVCLDDDIEGIIALDVDKHYPWTCSSLFIDAKREMDKTDLTLWGVNAVSNTFFMKGQDEISHNLKFCIGVMHGYINKKYVLPIECAQKEDYVNTIMHYRDWGGVIRFNHISPKTKYYAKGGLESKKERSTQNEIAAHYIAETYPEYCKMFRRKDGTAEIRLNNSHRFKLART
tara:strand:- start:37 stop:789 length:753 start_codon:yes stop_codon:yes gene_type:complete